jgi:hypothetical protein
MPIDPTRGSQGFSRGMPAPPGGSAPAAAGRREEPRRSVVPWRVRSLIQCQLWQGRRGKRQPIVTARGKFAFRENWD